MKSYIPDDLPTEEARGRKYHGETLVETQQREICMFTIYDKSENSPASLCLPLNAMYPKFLSASDTSGDRYSKASRYSHFIT
jgi:hypothetical protein